MPYYIEIYSQISIIVNQQLDLGVRKSDVLESNKVTWAAEWRLTTPMKMENVKEECH